MHITARTAPTTALLTGHNRKSGKTKYKFEFCIQKTDIKPTSGQ